MCLCFTIRKIATIQNRKSSKKISQTIGVEIKWIAIISTHSNRKIIKKTSWQAINQAKLVYIPIHQVNWICLNLDQEKTVLTNNKSTTTSYFQTTSASRSTKTRAVKTIAETIYATEGTTQHFIARQQSGAPAATSSIGKTTNTIYQRNWTYCSKARMKIKTHRKLTRRRCSSRTLNSSRRTPSRYLHRGACWTIWSSSTRLARVSWWSWTSRAVARRRWRAVSNRWISRIYCLGSSRRWDKVTWGAKILKPARYRSRKFCETSHIHLQWKREALIYWINFKTWNSIGALSFIQSEIIQKLLFSRAISKF